MAPINVTSGARISATVGGHPSLASSSTVAESSNAGTSSLHNPDVVMDSGESALGASSDDEEEAPQSPSKRARIGSTRGIRGRGHARGRGRK